MKKNSESTPIRNQKIYILQDSSNYIYKVIMTYCSDKLIIEIEQEDSFPKIYYSSTFILEEIQKNDKWFRLFDSFEECSDIINGLFEDKKVKLITQENNINIVFTHLEKYVSESVFSIEKKEEQEAKDELITKLLESHNDIRNRMKILEKSNKELSEKINKILSIPKIAYIFSKDKKNFLEGIVKDEEDKNLIFSWINLNFEKVSAKLIYSAEIDGDDSLSFHLLCDNIGPNLTLVKSIDGKIFGGYTRENWSGDNQYKKDDKAFIFSMDFRRKAELTQKNNAIHCSPTSGPTFGNDLKVCSGCLTVDGSYFRTGYYKFKINNNNNEDYNYGSRNPFSSQMNNYLSSSYNFKCKNVEVYAIIEN